MNIKRVKPKAIFKAIVKYGAMLFYAFWTLGYANQVTPETQEAVRSIAYGFLFLPLIGLIDGLFNFFWPDEDEKDKKLDLLLENQQDINHRLDKLQQTLILAPSTTNNLALVDDTKPLPAQEGALLPVEKNGSAP